MIEIGKTKPANRPGLIRNNIRSNEAIIEVIIMMKNETAAAGASAAGEKKDCCACSEKHKERSPEEYKDLINRLSRIEGQVRGIKAMVERGAYCPDILIQTSAVNSALNSFSKVLLSNHIRTCVRNDIREGNDEVVEELVTTLQKMMK